MTDRNETSRFPAFASRWRNKSASPDNPRRDAFFVTLAKCGGEWRWQMTDGQGDFWTSNPASMEAL